MPAVKSSTGHSVPERIGARQRLLGVLLAFAVLAPLSAAVGKELLGQHCSQGTTAELSDASLAIVNARIYPAPQLEPIGRGTVILGHGRILAIGAADEIDIPPGVQKIDGAGTVITAGFWNSHVHFLAPPLNDASSSRAEVEPALVAMLTRWGFTSVFDIAGLGGNAAALRTRIDSGELVGPAILHVDAPFYPEDGTPIYVRGLLLQLGEPSAEVSTAEQGRERVRRQIEAGADGVKIFAGAIVGGDVGVLPMDVEIANAIVGEAHRLGKVAFAHPTDLAGLEVSIASGVDVLAHTTPFSGPWDQALVERLREANLALVPTLTLFESELQRENAPVEVVERFIADATQQVRAFSAAGGEILFGTDVDYMDHVDTRREFELMARADMDWRAIFASLTSAPAERFGYGGCRGKLALGMEADLVVLGSDPAEDVTGFANVRTTIRGGVVIYQAGHLATQKEER